MRKRTLTIIATALLVTAFATTAFAGGCGSSSAMDDHVANMGQSMTAGMGQNMTTGMGQSMTTGMNGNMNGYAMQGRNMNTGYTTGMQQNSGMSQGGMTITETPAK